jgi:RNA polymerase sigma-70 factor (ECF subfamily)
MAAAEGGGRPVSGDDDVALVARARAGDRDAAAALLLRHELTVHRICAHLLPRGQDIEAAVQETFVRALRSLGHYGGSGTFAAWMASIAVNLCRDRLRRHRLAPFVALEPDDEEGRGPLAVLASATPSPERAAMARQAMARVRAAVAALPERQREVFALRFWAGLDLAAIAEALGVDVGTVKTHLHRSVQRVRSAAEEAMP